MEPIQLDGDDLRLLLRTEAKGYSYTERVALGYQYGDLCHYLAKQGHVVLIATIALFHEIHARNRVTFANYIEVFMDTPEEVLLQRDSKGLYAGHAKGEVKQVVGLDWAAEMPKVPDLSVTPDEDSQRDAVEVVARRLSEIKGHLSERGGAPDDT